MHRFKPLFRREVAIAGRQGQAVIGALGFAGQNVNGQGKLPHHAPHHQNLLIVFFTECCHAARHAGKYAGKQFHYDGAHANEKTGPKMAFKQVAQVSCRMHLERLWLRVKVFFARGKQNIATRRFKSLGIGVHGARVAVEVFIWRKLQPVDKNARHRHIAQRFCFFHQRNMAGMQVAHGGYKSRLAKRAELRAQLGNGLNNVHGVFELFFCN